MNKTHRIAHALDKLLSEEELSRLESSLSELPVTSVRVNPAKINDHSYSEKVPWCENGYYLNERPVFTLDPQFHGGAYYVQEASSMFLHSVMKQITDNDKKYNVLDICAAPGGKTTLISSILPGGSLLVANEVIKNRAVILKENIVKWGCTNTVITNNEAEDFQKLPHFFDIIVIDAPCSGEGLIRKDKNAIDEWNEENVQMCADRQKKIFEEIWETLMPGGILIYSTCTFNTKENEENLKWLAENKNVKNVDLEIPDAWNIFITETNGIKGYRFFPHKIKGEGFFISVMQKPEGEIIQAKKLKKYFFHPAPEKIKKEISEWVKQSGSKKIILQKEMIGCIENEIYDRVEHVVQNLKPVYSFLPVAEIKGKDLIPAHELAFSVTCNNQAFSVISVEKETALNFLRKDELKIERENGWHLIQFNEINLGWIKKIGNRINNYYPLEWRIRMRS